MAASASNGKVTIAQPGSAGVPLHPIPNAEPVSTRSLPSELWEAWKAYSHRAGSYQARVLLSLVYFLVLGPSAVVAGLTGTRLLDLNTKPRQSYWLKREPFEASERAMERPF